MREALAKVIYEHEDSSREPAEEFASTAPADRYGVGFGRLS